MFLAIAAHINRPVHLLQLLYAKALKRIGSNIWIILQVFRSKNIKPKRIKQLSFIIDLKLLSFVVDFDEEYSALFGGLLDDQSIYLELCIKAVLNLYKDLPNPPTSVSIVAHSMVNTKVDTFEYL